MFSSIRNFVVVLCLAGVLCCESAYAYVPTDDVPPADSPWLGGFYISGVDSHYGDLDLYFPVKEGWCVTRDGFLFRYFSGSVYGVAVDKKGTQYDLACSGFDFPRVRRDGDSRYTYLRLDPLHSNCLIDDSFAGRYDTAAILQYTILGILGLIFVCQLRKR